MAAGIEHPPRFSVRPDFVRDEHDAELAEDEVEASVGEGKILCVRRLERHPVGKDALPCELEYRRVYISRDDLRLRHRLTHRASNDPGAGGCVENAGGLQQGRACCNVPRIRLEQQRAHIAVVESGGRVFESSGSPVVPTRTNGFRASVPSLVPVFRNVP